MSFLTLLAIVSGLLLLGGICWAGASNPIARPWPYGTQTVRIGSFVPNGKGDNTTPATVAKWIAPYDCYVRRVTEYLYNGSARLDLVTIRTIDSTKKTIVTQVADPAADVDGVIQTLHADIINFKIVAGNGIEVLADSSQSNESGQLYFDVEIEPAYSGIGDGQ